MNPSTMAQWRRDLLAQAQGWKAAGKAPPVLIMKAWLSSVKLLAQVSGTDPKSLVAAIAGDLSPRAMAA